MERYPVMIGVVSGAPGRTIQALLRDVTGRWRQSARIVGVIEDVGSSDQASCSAGALVSLRNHRRFAIFQELGSGSEACNLDPRGGMDAGEAVSRDIEDGCDLVLLSKFGKLEAEFRGGLMPAFAAAIEAGKPVLTSVAPRFADAWKRFAEGLYVDLPAETEALEQWWRDVRALAGKITSQAAGS